MTATQTPSTLLALHAADPEGLNRIAAEMAGWKREVRRSYRETPGWFHPNGVSMFNNPPHYSTSLDAVAELEAGLTDEEQDRYIDWLLRTIVVPAEAEYGVALSDTSTMWVLLHSTAAQRLIAWVLTKQTI